jgi:hypothetical protein
LLLNSGTGHFGWLDPIKGKFEPLAFCPGYLRGLDVVGKFALIGLSKPRENRTFSGLELDDNLKTHKVDARCGIYVVDLKSGDIVHWARIEGPALRRCCVARAQKHRSCGLQDPRNQARDFYRSLTATTANRHRNKLLKYVRVWRPRDDA